MVDNYLTILLILQWQFKKSVVKLLSKVLKTLILSRFKLATDQKVGDSNSPRRTKQKALFPLCFKGFKAFFVSLTVL